MFDFQFSHFAAATPRHPVHETDGGEAERVGVEAGP